MLDSRSSISDALVVPVEAVHADERGSFAAVSSALGSPTVRRIEVGRSTAGSSKSAPG